MPDVVVGLERHQEQPEQRGEHQSRRGQEERRSQSQAVRDHAHLFGAARLERLAAREAGEVLLVKFEFLVHASSLQRKTPRAVTAARTAAA